MLINYSLLIILLAGCLFRMSNEQKKYSSSSLLSNDFLLLGSNRGLRCTYHIIDTNSNKVLYHSIINEWTKKYRGFHFQKS